MIPGIVKQGISVNVVTALLYSLSCLCFYATGNKECEQLLIDLSLNLLCKCRKKLDRRRG